MKTVTPTLASTGGQTLYYLIEIHNTGAYTAENTHLLDPIPANTTYNNDATASQGPSPTVSNGELSWDGTVGFDQVVFISFSVDIDAGFAGDIENTAVISQAMIAAPISITANSAVTDLPILALEKTATPAHPGANKPLTYTIAVINWGQPLLNQLITVTDEVPADTTLAAVGSGGIPGPGNASVIWTRSVTLSLGDSTMFTFSVNVNNVPSGTVIANNNYQVDSAATGVVPGQVYTVTVVDPIFTLAKSIWPDPPGSNREMTYTLELLNQGSLATNIIVTDVVPANVTYVRGGTLSGNEVSWTWPRLDTGETAEFTFTVYIDDVANVEAINNDYGACSAEGVCQVGSVVTHTIQPAHFEAHASLNPIAKKPGGGGGPVTPTLTVENIGPGNALDATALLIFQNISVQDSDILVIPNSGTVSPGPDCGSQCSAYLWIGDLDYSQVVTFTTIDGQNTIGGAEGNRYTATVIITDTLSNMTTEPISATAVGRVTHKANLIPLKSAPARIGRGQAMTYTLTIWNSALSTDEPPFPWVTDTVPLNTTLLNISHDGASYQANGRTVVSWTLPSMNSGDTLRRSFSVRVDNDLVSGTKIINQDYQTFWYEAEDSTILSNTGQPVTTTVLEVGLIDSYKTVTPALALPGPDNMLTFYLHLVNSGPVPLTGITVYDWLPWQNSTYQRDAIATAGQVISDIVSVQWIGSVAAFSEEVITLTVKVDPYYKGALTNTAVISHPNLLSPVIVNAVAYITDEPVLTINKHASPDPVQAEGELLYTIRVQNLGQQATNLMITDTIPTDTTYIPNSATSGGQLMGNTIQWQTAVLEPGESRTYAFRVLVGRGETVTNDRYGVLSSEGVSAQGKPVITPIIGGDTDLYLPIVYSQ